MNNLQTLSIVAKGKVFGEIQSPYSDKEVNYQFRLVESEVFDLIFDSLDYTSIDFKTQEEALSYFIDQLNKFCNGFGRNFTQQEVTLQTSGQNGSLQSTD